MHSIRYLRSFYTQCYLRHTNTTRVVGLPSACSATMATISGRHHHHQSRPAMIILCGCLSTSRTTRSGRTRPGNWASSPFTWAGFSARKEATLVHRVQGHSLQYILRKGRGKCKVQGTNDAPLRLTMLMAEREAYLWGIP